MIDLTVKIIIAILSSNALFTFVTVLIQRKDKKNDKIKEIEEDVKRKFQERDEYNKERDKKHDDDVEELRRAVIALTEDSIGKHELEKYMASSLMALSHDKLVNLGKSYQRRGAITLAEKNNIKLIYNPYHNLGGNSDGEGWFDYCMHLPVITEEEAIEMDNKNRQEQLRQLHVEN